MSLSLSLIHRLRAAGLHLLISTAIAMLAAGLVSAIWYPGIYRTLAGGQELFLLLTSVDVVLGPLLTFTVFNVAKGRKHLRRDVIVIGLIQTAALAYGLHTVFVARPVALVFEGGRFRVVSAQEVRLSELPNALSDYRTLPLTGPWLLGTREARSISESNDALFMAVGGVDLGQRPSFWQHYSESRPRVLTRSRPIETLLARYPERRPELQARVREMNVDLASSRFLPIIARGDWTVVINSVGDPVGYLPINGFF